MLMCMSKIKVKKIYSLLDYRIGYFKIFLCDSKSLSIR